MKAIVAVVGIGLLADMVCEALTDRYNIVHQTDFTDFTKDVPKESALVLAVDDNGDNFDYSMVEETLRLAGIPWLRGFVSLDEGVVGPLVHPDKPGCSQCADNRRFNAGSTPDDASLEWMHENTSQVASLSPLAFWQMALLLASETQRVLEGGIAHTDEHMYRVNLRTMETSLHFFLPDPLCPLCGQLPEDASESARITLSSSPKVSQGSYRSCSIDELKEVLIHDYLDARTGLFNARWDDLGSLFTAVGVNMPSFDTGDEVAGGRSHSYGESVLTAILEGLERRSGSAPLGKQTVVNDSYNHLTAQALNALDPASTGFYTKEQYAQPDFPFEPFDPDSPIDWVWGYSFLQERPILVPGSLAYYSSYFGDAFVQEGSNGCALGGTLEEAILHGILEVVERDSFLITWYANLSAPRLDPLSANDQELKLMIERLRAVAGYEVHLFNMTMENGIPSIWALAKNGTPGKVNLICSAGAHLDPVKAAKSAIHELSGLLGTLQEKLETHREELVAMLDDSFLVQHMESHSMLYSLPEAEERLLFLLNNNRPLCAFDEAFTPKAQHADLTDDLKDVIQVFRGLNLDVIVVDQTSPEIARNGFKCVKVLIPGMLPMTFGHHLTRLKGLERVFRIPAELGYAKQPLTPEQLNPYPHPFP